MSTSQPSARPILRATLRATAIAALVAAFTGLTACSGVPARSNPLPAALYEQAVVPGAEDARFWGDETPTYVTEMSSLSPAQVRAKYSAIMDKEHNYLVLSGGGENGAFGAGLLKGWTESGTRPQFDMVTGVSAGALIAPFAFLGSEYDYVLESAFTTHENDDFAKKRGKFAALRKDAVADSAPLRHLIDVYLTEEIVEKIGAEFRAGRDVLIGTTNLDAGRPVIWSIGKIAASDFAGKRELIIDVMLASASIPAIFPPVFFEVEAQGQLYDEMHADGGVTRQAFLYPLKQDWKLIEEILQVRGKPTVWVVRNGFFESKYEIVKRKTLPIAARTAASLTRTQGLGDTYRFYLAAIRDGLSYKLASIPEDFDAPHAGGFDPEYMKPLFALGYELARDGYPWADAPPDFDLQTPAAAEPAP